MKTIFLIAFLLIFQLAILPATGQQLIQLKFTATQMNQHISMDSIRIQNISKDCDTVLHWPDTILSIAISGINDNLVAGVQPGFIQSIPNPLTDKATVKVYMPEPGRLDLEVTDLLGRRAAIFGMDLPGGTHDFQFSPGGEKVYIISARFKNMAQSIKVISLTPNPADRPAISYEGSDGHLPQAKSLATAGVFTILPGDIMRCVGYKDSLVAVMREKVINNITNVLSFGLNPPCSGQTFLTYGGEEYLTVKIDSQCWMAENLNVGIYKATTSTGISHSDVTNNGIIEKYCYYNDSNVCKIYGGLYDWNEMMGYDTTPGVQGICPPAGGWHLPTDAEWTTLITFLGGEIVAGGKMKATATSWTFPNPGATNSSGFTALGAGGRGYDGMFFHLWLISSFWSSSQDSSTGAYARYLQYDWVFVDRWSYYKTYGFSIRCLRNN